MALKYTEQKLYQGNSLNPIIGINQHFKLELL